MVVLDKKLEDVQAPGGRTVKQIVTDVNEKGVCEAQIDELLNCMSFIVERLVYSDSERFA